MSFIGRDVLRPNKLWGQRQPVLSTNAADTTDMILLKGVGNATKGHTETARRHK